MPAYCRRKCGIFWIRLSLLFGIVYQYRQKLNLIEFCSILVNPSREICPSGYTKRKGDVPGWGSNIGSRLDLTLEQCAKRCNNEISCLSFEHSPSQKECNLNKIAEPTRHPNADFMFCSKRGSVNDLLKTMFHGVIGYFVNWLAFVNFTIPSSGLFS